MGRVFPSFSSSTALFACFLTTAFADVPKIDFERMGVVAVGGTFAGLDFYTANSTNLLDASSSTLLTRAANSTITSLASTNGGGSINAVCVLGNTLYVGGNFSSLSGSSYSNIAAYDATTHQFSALQSGLDGTVYALYCDSSSNQIWAGGDFNAPVGANATQYGGSVALFDAKASTWAAPGFFGLSGAQSVVRSITPGIGPGSTSLYFAGSFLTSFGTNATTNSTNNPNVPYSPGATPYSSALVPIPLGSSDINANPSSSDPDYHDIDNILCPLGTDGPGNTWFSQNSSATQITVRTNKFNNARGLRLGNTFLGNHSTKAFKVTAIPSNVVLNLTYIDPTSKASLTCSTSCPLLSDPSVPYQDFLFPGSTTLTGVQITILEWNGASAGLHLLQLLSAGAFASAITNNNGRSCFSPNASGVFQSGRWAIIDAVTGIAGTTQSMLEATVKVGTAPVLAPELTWLPYVSASGIYNVYVYVPGCRQFGDCRRRTSVDVTVYPGGIMPAVTQTVNEQVQNDVKVLLYTGLIIPTAYTYSTTIKLALAASATGPGVGGNYAIIADRVELELVSLNTNGTNGGSPFSGANNTGSLTHGGFGFFEWNLGNSGNANATGVISNSSETIFDAVSTAFASALGSSVSTAIVNSVVPAGDNNTLFLGGSFIGANNVTSNIVSFTNGTIVPLAGQGLNGNVTSLAFSDNVLYVGGSFGDVVDNGSSVAGLRNIAKFDLGTSAWTALGGGLNGPVTSLSISGGQLLVGGNFTETFANSGDTFGPQSGGVATWDISSSKWMSGGSLVLGPATLATDSNGVEYIAGNFGSVSGNSAAGWAILSADKKGVPSFGDAATPLIGIVKTSGTLQNTSTSPAKSPTPSARRRRSTTARAHEGSLNSWLNIPSLFTSSSTLSSRQSSLETVFPDSSTTPAPAVLAVAFWTNQTKSDEAVILGGNFSFVATGADASQPSSGIALYYPNNKTITALEGPQVNGTVHTLFVTDHSLYAGGNFSVGSFTGLAVYDLYSLSWQSNIGTLSASDGETAVRSISSPRSQPQYVIVAGTFAGAGGVTCEAICAFDTSGSKWVGLGNGIKGEVVAVDYAKDGSHDVLVVAGSITLGDGTVANVAKYHFSNSTWAAVGSNIPGPVTAVSVDNDNLNSIFAAGRSSDGSSPFVLHWDGSSWNWLNTPLNGATTFSQLTFVPLVDDHSANSVISKDRMLMVSGALVSDSFGKVSTALFDGQTWYPYMTSTAPSGAPGVIAGLYHSFSRISFSRHNFLATGVVILISIAIAAGIVFFLLLAGVLWTLLSRESAQTDQKAFVEDDNDSVQNGPSSLLEHINAATRSTIVGTGAGVAGVGAAAGAAAVAGDRQSPDERGVAGPSTEGGHTTDADGWRRSETPAVAAGAGIVGSGNEPEEEVGRPAFARYSFDGEGEGELALQTGAQLAILDDRDPAWWYVRDEQSGREGIVPAAYLY